MPPLAPIVVGTINIFIKPKSDKVIGAGTFQVDIIVSQADISSIITNSDLGLFNREKPIPTLDELENILTIEYGYLKGNITAVIIQTGATITGINIYKGTMSLIWETDIKVLINTLPTSPDIGGIDFADDVQGPTLDELETGLLNNIPEWLKGNISMTNGSPTGATIEGNNKYRDTMDITFHENTGLKKENINYAKYNTR